MGQTDRRTDRHADRSIVGRRGVINCVLYEHRLSTGTTDNATAGNVGVTDRRQTWNVLEQRVKELALVCRVLAVDRVQTQKTRYQRIVEVSHLQHTRPC